MTTLEDRLRDATVELGDAPHDAPPFAVLQRRHRRRRRRATVTFAGTAAVLLVCAATALAMRGEEHRGNRLLAPPTNASAASSSTSTSVTTTTPFDGQKLEAMPRFDASAVHSIDLSPAVAPDRAVFSQGKLFFVGSEPGLDCPAACPWFFLAEPATGKVTPLGAPQLTTTGIGALAIGDGGAFVVTFNYDGSPLRVTGFDLVSGRARFTVPIPGTAVYGSPKARLTYAFGAVWLSQGTLPVVKLDPHTGAVLATIALPPNGAETNGNVGFAVDASGVWLVGGTSGTAIIHIDPVTNTATAFTSFGAGFTQSLAADGTHVWTTHFAGSPARLDLVRIDEAHPSAAAVTGIPTAQVATGDGQVWFLGYQPGLKAADPANHYGIVGRIDPVTLKVIGVTEIDSVSALGSFDEPQLIVAEGSAWVFDAHMHRITQITSP